jgi:hypothetical protein
MILSGCGTGKGRYRASRFAGWREGWIDDLTGVFRATTRRFRRAVGSSLCQNTDIVARTFGALMPVIRVRIMQKISISAIVILRAPPSSLYLACWRSFGREGLIERVIGDS